MVRVRILPALILSLGVLFAMKAGGFLLDGRVRLSGIAPALAQEEPVTGRVTTERPEEQPIEGSAVETSQDRILERLGERRRQLDERERDLDLREQLLQAAEQRLADRVGELEALEQRIGVALDEREEQRLAEVQRLITMYESMRAKDAAEIMNELDLSILLEVARRMNPRKMADIMAQMQPDAARRLTIALAMNGGVQDEPVTTQSIQALPQIEGEPIPAPEAR
ncbi:MAG: hypothetical protein KDI98_02125 [Hyphomicrobiaceae bacterium]|nr:hypothetical protein [Hyphomicrobiaceae bacterium]